MRAVSGKARDKDGYSLGEGASRYVGRRVADLLKKKGMTKTALSEAASAPRKIPLSHLSDLLSDEGRRRFQRWHVQQISAALGVDESVLLPTGAVSAAQGSEITRMSDRSGSISPLQKKLGDALARNADKLTGPQALAIRSEIDDLSARLGLSPEVDESDVIIDLLARILGPTGRGDRG